MATEREIQTWMFPGYVKKALGKHFRMVKIERGAYRVYPESHTGVGAFSVFAVSADPARHKVRQYVVNKFDVKDGRAIPKKE